ncbi:MAG: hypothetical protein GXP08_01520 [Gammaproteobacteria bacterium]|nr:hypothetical protein [Gammaproteobacteria bacterium]
MQAPTDRLYELLPVIYRQRDAEKGYPLRALLRIINEQVDIVESDIAQLYENWFIETAQDWVVPYIGDLVGYRLVHDAGEPGDVTTEQGRLRNKILIPRREVANTIRFRRRKGTLALLELLARDVAGWPARAVEFYTLLGVTQSMNHLRLNRGRTANLRDGEALDKLNGPFDEMAHTVDARRITSHRMRGRYNIPDVGLFVWRLKSYSVTQTPAYCLEDIDSHFFSFSVLGNDTPLYTRPRRETEPTSITGELNMPVPMRRRAFDTHKASYYGEGSSLQIWEGVPRTPVEPERIVVAELTNWQYRPARHQVAVDPQLGRIAFPPGKAPKKGVWVSYHYGFSADIGGGEYKRMLSQPEQFSLYTVGEGAEFQRIADALRQWQEQKPQHAVIEITHSSVYVEQINIELQQNQTLQLRAANHTRPVIRLLDWQTDRPDSLWVTGEKGSRFTLDGLLVTGRGFQVEGELDSVLIRHTTLVPGWTLALECDPHRPAEPSLDIYTTDACIVIQDSIIGAIHVHHDEVKHDPILIKISDSIVDATSNDRVALDAPGWPMAHALLTIKRSTVFGQVLSHAIELAENSIFMGQVRVARRQIGCMRFCYVESESRIPRRYRCQPELAEQTIERAMRKAADEANLPAPNLVEEIAIAQQSERLRVRPQFNSTRYATPIYCQLSAICAEEIRRGADDESEMGVFHNLFQPQREANLNARLGEHTVAGMETGIVYAS